jgi:hypothetical protein
MLDLRATTDQLGYSFVIDERSLHSVGNCYDNYKYDRGA